jgi:hypothetical protein
MVDEYGPDSCTNMPGWKQCGSILQEEIGETIPSSFSSIGNCSIHPICFRNPLVGLSSVDILIHTIHIRTNTHNHDAITVPLDTIHLPLIHSSQVILLPQLSLSYIDMHDNDDKFRHSSQRLGTKTSNSSLHPNKQ